MLAFGTATQTLELQLARKCFDDIPDPQSPPFTWNGALGIVFNNSDRFVEDVIPVSSSETGSIVTILCG